jgi:hypothetical protein
MKTLAYSDVLAAVHPRNNRHLLGTVRGESRD